MNLDIDVPEKILPLYGTARYKVFYGGRGAGKTLNIADYCLIKTAFSGNERILCTREFQSSIKDSVHRVLCDRIDFLKLNKYFVITRDEIRSIAGSMFIFKGLAHNSSEIKSMQGITKVWCEEAERITEESWDILIPTIREENSEIIISFNPNDEKAATYQRFVINPPENTIIVKINYYDNPFLPKVLLQEIEYDKQYNPDKYQHIWEGNPKRMSNAIIFKDKFVVEEFDIQKINDKHELFNGDRITYKYGLDFGFSTDPTALIECFTHNGCLYITKEIYSYHLETDDLVPLIQEKIPRIIFSNDKIYADGSRPETIAQLNRSRMHHDGKQMPPLNVESAIKGKGSIIEGIEYLRNFKKIIIHPRCKNTIYEFNNYSYKQDKVTGEILPVTEDKDCHAVDSIRYAFNREIQALKKSVRTSSAMAAQFL